MSSNQEKLDEWCRIAGDRLRELNEARAQLDKLTAENRELKILMRNEQIIKAMMCDILCLRSPSTAINLEVSPK